jgi:hypothetical protein
LIPTVIGQRIAVLAVDCRMSRNALCIAALDCLSESGHAF